ncbi:MAG: hypothetical protein FWG68_08170 [Defluviitaleaceae bacterium]|nr:hypothetical protein [Defluviitaleaceae bacterium]
MQKILKTLLTAAILAIFAACTNEPPKISTNTIFVHPMGVRIIDNNGDLWGWGRGELPINETPTKIMSNVQSVHNLTFATDTDNNLWTWGNWENEFFATPTMIFENVAQVHFGITSHILTKSGEMWSFHNFGDGLHMMSDVAKFYTTATGSGVFAITSDGTLYSWGRGRFLGNGLPNNEIPMRVMENVGYVAANSMVGSAFIITTDGSLYGMGENFDGQLGNGTLDRQETPQFIMGNVASVRIVGTRPNATTFAITQDNALYSWGSHIGLGSLEFVDMRTLTRNKPARVLENVADLFIAENTFFAITVDKALWGWGANNSGQLGGAFNLGISSGSIVPVPIMDGVSTIVMDSFGRTRYALGGGELWAWGSNSFGEVGNGAPNNLFPVPSHIMGNVVSVHFAAFSAFAITSDNELWAWGRNDNGQLGDGTFINRGVPVLIMENVRGW